MDDDSYDSFSLVMDANSLSLDESSSVTDILSEPDSFSDSSSHSSYIPYDDDCFVDNLKVLVDSKYAKDKEALKQIVINTTKTDNAIVLITLARCNYKLEVLNDYGQTLMHLAFYNESDQVLYYCISDLHCIESSYTNYTDCNGLSHLHLVCQSVQEETLSNIKKYLKKGADVNAPSFETDRTKSQSGFTPLHWASSALLGFESVVTLLLKYKAHIDAVDGLGRTALHLLCSMFRIPTQFSSKYDRVLERMKVLLKGGCNVNARDKQGSTPLHNVFLDNDNFVNMAPFDKPNSPPVRETWLKFKLLLKYGADVTAVNNNNETILHCVIKSLKLSRSQLEPTFDDHVHVQIIEKMLAADENIDVNAMNCAAETPLQLAVSMMSVNIIKLLLDHNADISKLSLIKNYSYCFYKSMFLPNLKAIKSAMDMLELLLDKDFILDLHENLAFMRFLLHDIDYNTWAQVLDTTKDRNSKRVQKFVENLLEYGSPGRIKTILSQMIVTVLAKEKIHLKKRIVERSQELLSLKKIADFYVDQEIYNVINITDDQMLSHTRDQKIGQEIALIKSTFVTDDVSLHDIMAKHPFVIHQYVRDINIEELTRELIYFETSVKGHVTKSLVRNYVKKSASDYLRLLLPPLLPNPCCENITYFLSNEDIMNVCFAALSINVSQ